MNLSIFKLTIHTQASFWFILFNWIECNNYSITIGPERRKILAEYYSRSNDPNSRSAQNIFRELTKSGLLLKCRQSDLICKSYIAIKSKLKTLLGLFFRTFVKNNLYSFIVIIIQIFINNNISNRK